ncbi:DNA repair protein [Alcaligenes sp. SORT26]|uniref:DNA repair protein n=1 Tax=Alcaligenes sp. SORT26 TaxID=2813780 RepID=UPI001A9D7C4C|nr:DNA repair protein [Alcaligenes sp. SORT26]QTB98625.1 DNA repair protein [Alcaligenes sp. SORT26]
MKILNSSWKQRVQPSGRKPFAMTLCAVLLAGLGPWAGPAMAQKSDMEERLRTQLRSSTQQLQQLQSQQAQLTAAKTAAETERDAARKEVEQLKARLDKSSQQAQTLKDEQEGIKTSARQQVAAAQSQLGRARNEFETLQVQARATETQRASLASSLAQREEELALCTAKNKELYAAGKEILAAYEQFSTGDLLKIRQPLAASARVKFDEHAQALGDKLYDGLYTPGAAETTAPPVAP